MTVVVLATLDSKEEEARHLAAALRGRGRAVRVVDLSLGNLGTDWTSAGKIEGMNRAAARAIEELAGCAGWGARAVLAIGGGTGGQIAVKVLQSLPLAMPRVLVSTFPFDPRYAFADTPIVLVPTIADLSGLNATTAAALDRAAAIAAQMAAEAPPPPLAEAPSVAITALGVTARGAEALRAQLVMRGHAVTVFHANGFGGAALARWTQAGAFTGLIDYTPHELTRLHVAGAHVAMPHRFTAAGALPRVVVPGGINIIGLGEADLMPDLYRRRPHYAHSPLFTHVKCTTEEAVACARILARALAQGTGPARVLVPMGGFSSEDKPGGAVEDAGMRAAVADALRAALPARIPVTDLPGHVNDASTAEAAARALAEMLPSPGPARAPQEADHA